MTIEIVPFDDSLLPQAAELLARQHWNVRAVQPLVPARFETPEHAGRAIEMSRQGPQARGFAALEGDRLVAYLIGEMVINETWGRSGWIRLPGCAYDPQTGPEAVRDLYAVLGADWVRAGIFLHAVLVPVPKPDLIHTWFSLSFGIEQIHALIDLNALPEAMSSVPPGVEIRKAGPEDRALLAEMSDVIWRHQVQSPVWGIQLPELIGELRDGWAELVDEADATVWLALQDGELVGTQGYWPAEATDVSFAIPEQSLHMSVAGTRPAARGKGIATLLTRHGMLEARANGFRFCETDWRSTNLLASRFWPRQGFLPTVYRLVRRVDPRIAWANG